MSARGTAPAQLAPSDLLERVARALHDAPAGKPFALSLPAPPIHPLALLAPGEDALLWTDRDGSVIASRGSVFRIPADGPSRLSRLADMSERLKMRVNLGTLDGEAAPSPRFVGGAAFAPGAAADDDWRGFDDASFDLPRFALIDDAVRGRRLQLAVPDPRLPQERARAVDELTRLLDAGDVPDDATPPTLRGDVASDADRSAWTTIVGEALRAIASGEASKIVAARRARFTAERAPEASAIAGALLRVEGAFRFVVRRGDVMFAGATPEQLIQRDGARVRSEALAGTARAQDAGEIGLDAREKDRREHRAVVDAIDTALRPVCSSLEHPAEPIVRRHGAIEHLATPFEGWLSWKQHVLVLAERLHPTPAVGGTPQQSALRFIAQHEPSARGWYAGPIGWFDLAGDGELAVALRCVRIDGTAVDVYAGAGIVHGSEPDAEFDETALKMRAALAAIGARTDA